MHSLVFGQTELDQFLTNSISNSNEKVHVSGTHHSPNKLSKVPIIQGELHPILQAKSPSSDVASANNKLPTIIITAHIDNFGLINVSFNETQIHFQTAKQISIHILQ